MRHNKQSEPQRKKIFGPRSTPPPAVDVIYGVMTVIILEMLVDGPELNRRRNVRSSTANSTPSTMPHLLIELAVGTLHQ